jgi:apolipoprotein N-acyltransferase
LGRYEALTREAAKDKPDLIIWPETAVPGVIGEEPELLERVSRLARAVNRPLLIGTTTAKIITHHPPLITHYYNSAILISSEGKVLRQYDKLHLVPFGEYVPLERYFPFLRELIGVPIGDFTAGKKYAIFEIASLAPAGLARNDA